MTFVLLTMDGVLVAGPSADEHWLAKIACQRAERGASSQLFQLERPVIFQPVTPRRGDIECEASS